MLVLDPWSKAAECDRAIERRLVLESLQSVWIEVCDSLSLFDGSDRAHDLSAIAQIHRELMVACRTAMH
jgi:hypothetical protein